MAFPTGAGQCKVGSTSVAGQHVEKAANKKIKTGRLGAGHFIIKVNGFDLRKPFRGSAIRLKVGTTHNIRVESTRAVPTGDDLWRGVLLAATPNKTKTLFTFEKRFNDTDLQDATICADPTIGVTHTNSDRKQTAIVRFNSMNESWFFLDANVVVANNDTYSIYYYQQFKLRAVESCQPRNASCTTGVDCCLGYACVDKSPTVGRCNFCRRSGNTCANSFECCNGLTCRLRGGKKKCRAP